MAKILLDIFILFIGAKLAGGLFERLRQPPVVGELLVGVLIGPYALGLVGRPAPDLVATFHSPEAAQEALRVVYDVLAQIGVIFLLFFVGLETRLADLIDVGRRAAIVAGLGILVPFVLGYLLAAGLGYSGLAATFTATAMVATSVGITARVMADLGVLGRREARIILGAAVIDDILGLILLAIAIGSASDGTSWIHIVLVAAEAIAFTAFVVLLGGRIVRRYDAHLEAVPMRNGPFVVAMAVCLGLAALAAVVGLAAIIGAFLAGLVFAEARQREALIQQTMPVYDLLVPFFFAITGTLVNPLLFLDPKLLVLALLVTALAIAGKLIGCSIGAWGLPLKQVAVVGVGMVPRGEVGIIVASIGRALDALPGDLFSVLIAMSVLTTLVVPPALNALYRAERQ